MRVSLSVVLPVLLLGCGCAGHKPSSPSPGAPAVVRSGNKELIVTPDTAPAGRVVKVNQAGRFVVLNYPVGRLPALETRLGLYRRGLKVAVIKIVGPQYDDNIVADIVEGEAAPGDEARYR
ncbi:MAG: hypothetical protein ACLQVX_02195 [Limisphaerales bacterium]